MNLPDASTAENRSSSSGISGAYCAFTSTSGICWFTRASVAPDPRSSAGGRLLGEPATALLHVPPAEPCRPHDDPRRDHVFDVTERVVDLFPIRPGEIARTC